MRRETLVALIQLLADERESRVIVSSLHDAWGDALHGGVAQAREAIMREFETARCRRGGFFKARRRNLEALPYVSPLREMLATAKQLRFEFDPISLWCMLERCSGGRYILTESHRGRLRIVAWGKGYTSFSCDWIAQAPGRDFEDQPDIAYAKQAAVAYKFASETDVPLIEDVEASTWWPTRGRTQLRYTRMVMPLSLQGSRRLVLSSVQALGGA
jgi:hypothetical protein